MAIYKSDPMAPCSSTNIEDEFSLQFGDKSHLREITRLLCCSRPVFFRLKRLPEMTDHDFEQCKQKKLNAFCTRSCATVAGRGMLTLGSLASLRTLAESLPAN
jgi:hypothetical protein